MNKVRSVLSRPFLPEDIKHWSFDNPAFFRGSSLSSSRWPDVNDNEDDDHYSLEGRQDEEMDEEEFRSDLERDSVHGSLVGVVSPSGRVAAYNDSRLISTSALAHELRYEMLQRQGNRQASIIAAASATSDSTVAKASAALDLVQIDLNLTPTSSCQTATTAPLSTKRQRRTSSPPPLSRSPASRPSSFYGAAPLITDHDHQSSPASYGQERKKPPAQLTNLFGLIDPKKLHSLCGRGEDEIEPDLPYNPRYEPSGRRAGDDAMIRETRRPSEQPLSPALTATAPAASSPSQSSGQLFPSLCTHFVAGILLIMSYASPYWLQSWHDTDSPFKNMGLWEFCFVRFRHPDYQLDKLFNGCYALYGSEYHSIREKLLPIWLIVVQLLVTLALVSSFLGQGLAVALWLRLPKGIMARFERPALRLAVACQTCSAGLLLVSLILFAGCCWQRDWLLYPNYNFVSWSFGLAATSCLSHAAAAILLLGQAVSGREHTSAVGEAPDQVQLHLMPVSAGASSSYI